MKYFKKIIPILLLFMVTVLISLSYDYLIAKNWSNLLISIVLIILIGRYLYNIIFNNSIKKFTSIISNKPKENYSEKHSLINNDDNVSSDKGKKNFITNIQDKHLNASIDEKKKILSELKQQIALANEELEYIEYGLYKRKYKFSDSSKYKEALDRIRQREKDLIKSDHAGIIINPMMLNNSASKGKTMQKQLIKAMIRGFNGEADTLLSSINVSNLDRKIQSLNRIFEQINKLYTRNEVEISSAYLKLKKEELELAAEFELMKQQEKEKLREQREKEKEDKKLQEEIRRKRQQLEKDRTHYKQMIDNVEDMLINADEITKETLLKQLAEYQDKISELEEIEEDIDYREGHATAGYVYVISNIGSFGEEVYKIGVTRRLEPLERIAELSSASVPFRFDVHALVFSENAFGLEAELHRELDQYRVNKINNRKEYFKVPFSKIKEILNSHKELTVEFTEEAEAFEYKQSLIS
ncbi:DUF4041 domain-containing protein [Globicatella sulfidifaciens]|uniref:DUF4041 domain-containing protein n=1 Tax=Globicatella sulfidifaciens TaxID=136093 RepID=UPI00288D221D|nr:DUF4041 domain-containing protein [Globicatella sulfidifaciens]MDT2767709.1 DUF4041 domain-containing protein [Globicatella sulfidifaciens]